MGVSFGWSKINPHFFFGDNQMKTTLVFLQFVMSSLLFAGTVGTIEITATGEAYRNYDFIQVSAVVHSRCYEKAVDVVSANNRIVSEVAELLKKNAREKSILKNPFLLTGGRTDRGTETYYDPKIQESRVICKDKWRTSKTLKLKLEDSAKLTTLQEEVLMVVDKHGFDPSKNEAQTWVEFMSPYPELTQESRKELMGEALSDAIDNARRELKVIYKKCDNLTDVTLVSIAYPKESSLHLDRARSVVEGKENGVEDEVRTVPYEFGLIAESVTRVFTFSYSGGLEKCDIVAENSDTVQ